MAISSTGGHWAQLMRLRPAFEGCEIIYVSTQKHSNFADALRAYCVMEGNQNSKLRVLIMMLQVFFIVLRERPGVVISTGAAPGYFGLRFGKWFGARTLWLESIANAEKPSLSTRMVKPYADLFLTQWPHLAAPKGPLFKGTVL